MANNFTGTSSVVWKPGQFLNLVDKEVNKNLTKAGLFVVRDIKDKFPGSGIPNATKKERHANRSKKGEIPHVDTGSLKRSITRERVGVEERVGTNLLTDRDWETYP